MEKTRRSAGLPKVSTDNTCVVCGAVIPEGRQVCKNYEEGNPLQRTETGNPYYDYLIHEVQAVCNCPANKAAAIVSYVNSLGSNPMEFIKKLPEYVGQPHPDADEVLRSLEHIRDTHNVPRFGICFPQGYANRKERRRQEQAARRARKGGKYDR